MPRKSSISNVNRRPQQNRQDLSKRSVPTQEEVDASFHSASTDDGLTNYGLEYTDETMKTQLRKGKTTKAGGGSSRSRTAEPTGSRQESRSRVDESRLSERRLRQGTTAHRSLRSPPRRRRDSSDDSERSPLRRSTTAQRSPVRRSLRSSPPRRRRDSSDDSELEQSNEGVVSRKRLRHTSGQSTRSIPRSPDRRHRSPERLQVRTPRQRRRNSDDDDSELDESRRSRRRTPERSVQSASTSRRGASTSRRGASKSDQQRMPPPPVPSSSRQRLDSSQSSDDDLEQDRNDHSGRSRGRTQDLGNKDTSRGRGQQQPSTSTGAAPGRRKKAIPKKRPMTMQQQIIGLRDKTTNVIPKLPFSRLIKEILTNASGYKQIRVTSSALEALQESAEFYITQLFEDSYKCTKHRDRVTLMVKDMELVRYLRGPTDPGNW